jgi:hypothetical protein
MAHSTLFNEYLSYRTLHRRQNIQVSGRKLQSKLQKFVIERRADGLK